MIKYSIGVDVSSKGFYACISVIDMVQKVTVKSSSEFTNNEKGFEAFHLWIGKHYKQTDIPLVITMEATGVYYENVALYLYLKGYKVAVVLPNKAKKYFQATGLKSKNDRIDAQGLSRMGAEQSLELWQPKDEYFYQLRSLTRQHQSLQELKTNINNQLHADEHGMYQNQMVISQLKLLIKTINGQIKDLEVAIAAHLNKDKEVAKLVEGITLIKGVGALTVAIILAETNGFALFKNIPQLISFAGYDVVENQSGNHIGKTRISKKGNGHIRRCLHMPAFSVVRYQQSPFVQLFNRTLQRHGIKMKSYVAVQKKLLVLIYVMWKKKEAYQPEGKINHSGEQEQLSSSLLSFC
ncbi:MAG: IS110 family transposase [Chitinophagaceae bacterium]|nr:IS110 family transposase [Chitinophagaceae bacterium]